MARILIVDDETNIRTMMRLALKHVGYDVQMASDGPEALEVFSNGEDVDLVLLDQRMPGMEGLEVLRQMRQRNPAARVVMVTAFGTIDLAVDAMKAGATDFLRKPFSADTLRGAVRSALEGNVPSAPATGMTFGSTTINGYRIEFQAGSGTHHADDFQQVFTVRNPEGKTETVTVTLPIYVMELVKAHTDREQIPGGDRFWQALCEEALANHLWQNADFPPDGALRVEDLTTGLRRFVDSVLEYAG